MFVTCTTMRLPTTEGSAPPHGQPPPSLWTWSVNLSSKHWPQFSSPERPWAPEVAAAAKPILSVSLTLKGLLFLQVAARPPWQTEGSFGSSTTSPDTASQDRTGFSTLPFPGQAQLGLQQSQYPVVQVPVAHAIGSVVIIVVVVVVVVIVGACTVGAKKDVEDIEDIEDVEDVGAGAGVGASTSAPSAVGNSPSSSGTLPLMSVRC
mmetsp:Transcript_16814/g.42311  ORF Transcript_16814/g.42311 Transcript_16814/m.42311 type:complete len:206 (-) Transcript_16814:19-636(-)